MHNISHETRLFRFTTVYVIANKISNGIVFFLIVYFKSRKSVTYKWISIHTIHKIIYIVYINDILLSYKQFNIQEQRQ